MSTVRVSNGYAGNQAKLVVSPNGKFLYRPSVGATGQNAAGGGYHTINTSTGALSDLSGTFGGAGVANCIDVAVSPDSLYIYMGCVNAPVGIYQYSIDQTTGQPTPLSPASVPNSGTHLTIK